MDIRRAQIPCNMRFLPIDTPKAKQPSCVMQEGCFAVKYGGAAAVFQLYFSPAAKSYIAPSARHILMGSADLQTLPEQLNLWRGAGAPLPPSEEGGGTAYEGLKRRDGRRDTPSMYENSRYRRELNYNDTCIIWRSPTLPCKQQPRVISPSVKPSLSCKA